MNEIVKRAGGPIDIAIVLGSGLSQAFEARFPAQRIPYAQLPELPSAPLAGHAGEALIGTWNGKRVLALAGRVHLYQGFSAADVTAGVRFANDAGAKIIVLTNAGGALNPAFRDGDLMLLADHINLTGQNPLIAPGLENPFVDMLHAYSPHLRGLARGACATDERVREGIYIGLVGPSYETPAEAHYLRGIGGDAVGMSTVLETIAARHLGMDVLGISLITNVVGAPETSHTDVMAVAAREAPRIAAILDGILTQI